MTIPNSIVRNLDGKVVASPKVAAESAPILRRAMDEATRRDRVPFSDAAWDFLAGLEYMAKAAANAPLVAPLAALDEVPLPAAKVEPMKTVTKREAAKMLHCSPQAVQDRITRGTLPAAKDDRGHYRISVADLQTSEAPDVAQVVESLNKAEDGYLAALALIGDRYEDRAAELPLEVTWLLDALAERCRFGLAQVNLNTELLAVHRETSRSADFRTAVFSTSERNQ